MKMIPTIATGILLLALGSTGLAQHHASVSGTLTVSSNGNPVTGAQVVMTPGWHNTQTDHRGTFILTNISTGSYTISVASPGLQTRSLPVVVTGDTIINIKMDSLHVNLETITITGNENHALGIGRLRAVEGTSIYAGKKSEVITLDEVPANLATNNSRQIYSRVPGLNIWESDGAGLQLGIGGRGLSPNRTSNFNTRQNGYDISADALGYPESYYTPPAEALERIEIVRGAASLQYGTQFGGMVNFRMKRGSTEKKVEFLSSQTVGSFGLYSAFHSVGGTVRKLNYYAFHQYKTGNGWRPHSEFQSHTTYAAVHYAAGPRLTLTAEYTYMRYLTRQPGGLTDQMFEENPRQSIRSRNWFRVNWNLMALTIDYKLSPNTELNMRNFGLVAGRDALGFLGLINRADPMTERDLLTDHYTNAGHETRLLHRYKIFGKNGIVLLGGRYYQGFTERLQGYGSKGSDADFKYLHPENLEHSDYQFPSRNVALFAENIFYINPNTSIIPGVRAEYIHTAASGYYREENRDLAGNIIYQEKINDERSDSRSLILAGIGISHKPNEATEWYGSISQNYRAINFNDMRIVNPNLKVDPELKDEKGYSADLGLRGHVRKVFNYDLSLFLIGYNRRIGSLIMVDSVNFNTYRFRTNIADSRCYGAESFAEVDVLRVWKGEDTKAGLAVFINATLLDARYIHSREAAFDHKKVELVPSAILKTGLTFSAKKLKATWQYAYTSEHYTDATNAVRTSNAVNGIIPAYSVMDLSLKYCGNRFMVAAGINNMANAMYFTRRADGYPGPGIIPSDGRSVYMTIQVKL
ncbi:MAG: TonB-dependent receptor [Flavobacteriales bacterium]|nr:TonB-dependent receptor [Flavobacteriales bacterium]